MPIRTCLGWDWSHEQSPTATRGSYPIVAGQEKHRAETSYLANGEVDTRGRRGRRITSFNISSVASAQRHYSGGLVKPVGSARACAYWHSNRCWRRNNPGELAPSG